MRLFFLLLVLSSVLVLFAEDWKQDDFIFNPSGIPSLPFSQPRFADLDSDGDFDMIIGSLGEKLRYFENIGSRTNPSLKKGKELFKDIPSMNAELAVCCDMDNDGDLDLITGEYSGVQLYRNIGNKYSPVFSPSFGFFSGLSSGENPIPYCADIDSDGDPDLVLGYSENGSVKIFENTGSSTSPRFSASKVTQVTDAGLYAFPVLCDLDKDGDRDLLIGRDLHNFNYFRNSGKPFKPSWSANNSTFNGLAGTTGWNSPDLVDLNGDGLYDLIYGTSAGPIYYYENKGSASTPKWQMNNTLFSGVLDVGGASNPSLYDFDDDGDLDLISGSDLGFIKFYKNKGTANKPQWTENNSIFSGIKHSMYSSVSVGDINNDNLPDIVVGDMSGKLYVHKNTAKGFVEQSSLLSFFNCRKMSSPKLIDLDKDGDLDIIVGNDMGKLFFLENQGTASYPKWVEIPGYFSYISVEANCVPDAADIDLDNDVDIITGNLWGNIQFFENVNNSWAENSNYLTGAKGGKYSTPTVGDLDGDKDPDLVIGNFDGTFNFFRNPIHDHQISNPPLNPEVLLTRNAFLSWDSPLQGSSSPFQSYNVYLGQTLAGTTLNKNWVFTNLTGGVKYTAFISAVYEDGESKLTETSWIQNTYYPPRNLSYKLAKDYLHLNWKEPIASSSSFDSYNLSIDEVLIESWDNRYKDQYNPMFKRALQVDLSAVFADGAESSQLSAEIMLNSNSLTFCEEDFEYEYPHIFNPASSLYFTLKNDYLADVLIYDTKGNCINKIYSGTLRKGEHLFIWNGMNDLDSQVLKGIYVYKVFIDGQLFIKERCLIL